MPATSSPSEAEIDGKIKLKGWDLQREVVNGMNADSQDGESHGEKQGSVA